MPPATLALLLISQFAPEIDQPKHPSCYEVRLCVREKSVGQPNKPGEILTRPMVRVVAGSKAEVSTGETIHLDGQNVTSGTLAKVKVDPVRHDQVKMTGMIEVSTAGPPTEGVVVRESTSIHFVKTLDCGKTASINIAKNSQTERWVEVRVDHAVE